MHDQVRAGSDLTVGESLNFRETAHDFAYSVSRQKSHRTIKMNNYIHRMVKFLLFIQPKSFNFLVPCACNRQTRAIRLSKFENNSKYYKSKLSRTTRNGHIYREKSVD